ncbi:protein FAM227B isoform X3 [Canis lupus familiaris]|uniref:protein FAM227B isoform X3 n=1 Tax=Canis lupus familiaris TaxID=9615 RepID=UPI0018F43EF2|nr:protein FAM227B isoform X3 [Canis lupus familiaris]
MAGQLFPQWMVRAHCWKMQQPPRNIEEFLKFQNWDYWPREIHFEDYDKLLHTMKKIKEDSSFTSIYTHLWGTVPRIHDAVMAMESRLGECSILLKSHASKIFEWRSIIFDTRSKGKLERYKAFLRNYHRRKKIMLSDEMETKKTIEDCNFSGFKTNELTQLPRHLDAERIYLFILKAHNFDEKVFKIWKTHFLSEASIALLHDSFWWWFLHKFKVYPDCLAQAIYATFQEAFPESSNLFNDEFKEDLGNNIFLWLSGLKPQKGFWTYWKLKELSTTTIHGTKKAPSTSIKDRIERSQARITAAIDFNMTKILKNPRAYTMSTFKEESSISRLTTKSHYISTGPEFNRVLFNFGGQSPLILYYLKMHELAGISKAPRQTKIKLTEILQEPPPAPTYRDIIKEAKRQFARNEKDFRIEKHRINEEIKLLRQRQERIDKELDRLQAKATKKPYEVRNDFDKFLHKLHSEAQTEKEFLASLSSSSSIEDYNYKEEECQEQPEMNCV